MKIAQECVQKFPLHGTCFFLWREAGLGISRSLLKCQHLQTLETEVKAVHSVYLTIVGGRGLLILHSTCWGPDSSPSTQLALGSVCILPFLWWLWQQLLFLKQLTVVQAHQIVGNIDYLDSAHSPEVVVARRRELKMRFSEWQNHHQPIDTRVWGWKVKLIGEADPDQGGNVTSSSKAIDSPAYTSTLLLYTGSIVVSL